MKLFLSPLFLSILFIPVYGQQKINPVFKDSGFIWDVPFAIDKPDPSLHYKIVVEAGSAPENPAEDTVHGWPLTMAPCGSNLMGNSL